MSASQRQGKTGWWLLALLSIAAAVALFIIFRLILKQQTASGTPPPAPGLTKENPPLFPFISRVLPQQDAGGALLAPVNDQTEKPAGKLRMVSSGPVAGFSLMPGAESTLIYVERANGHVFEFNPDENQLRQLSNTTIPGVAEAIITDNKSQFFIVWRTTEEERQNLLGTVPKIASAAEELSAVSFLEGALPPSGYEFLISPSRKEIFYLEKLAAGSRGIIFNIEQKTKKVVLESPLREWLVSWPATTTLTFLTKPSFDVPGFLYSLNPQTGFFTKLLGGIKGLTASPSPGSGRIIISESGAGKFSSMVYQVAGKELSPVNLKLVPEKCAWANTTIAYCAVPQETSYQGFPDVWYSGRALFTDTIWKVNLADGTNELLYEPNINDETIIDATNLTYDPKRDWVYFINKRDSALWLLDLRKSF